MKALVQRKSKIRNAVEIKSVKAKKKSNGWLRRPTISATFSTNWKNSVRRSCAGRKKSAAVWPSLKPPKPVALPRKRKT